MVAAVTSMTGARTPTGADAMAAGNSKMSGVMTAVAGVTMIVIGVMAAGTTIAGVSPAGTTTEVIMPAAIHSPSDGASQKRSRRSILYTRVKWQV